MVSSDANSPLFQFYPNCLWCVAKTDNDYNNTLQFVSFCDLLCIIENLT